VSAGGEEKPTQHEALLLLESPKQQPSVEGSSELEQHLAALQRVISDLINLSGK
jgi:hypothetical protein